MGFCWCTCTVDRPSAHNWPVCRSSWCGKQDCRASVPNNPSDPILATTQHILHCSPGKTTFKLIRPTTVNGDESADTSRHVHRLNLSLTCGCTLHIFSKTDVANIVTCQPVSIMNSTSTSFVHPVRNQGAAEPTTPTIIASSSVSSVPSVINGSPHSFGESLCVEYPIGSSSAVP